MSMECVERFCFGWKIENFSKHMKKTSESFKSPSLVIDALYNTKCHLSLFPRGKEDAQYIGIYLTRADDGLKDVKLPINLTLEFKAADSSLQERRVSLKLIFERNTTWGFDRYIKRSHLLEDLKSCLLPNDTLTIFCNLEIAPFTNYITETMEETSNLEFQWSINNWSKFNYFSNIKKHVHFTGGLSANFEMLIYEKEGSIKELILKIRKIQPMCDIFLKCRVSLLDAHFCEILLQESSYNFQEGIDTISDNLFSVENLKDVYLKDDKLNMRCILIMSWSKRKIQNYLLEKKIDTYINDSYRKLFRKGKCCDVQVRCGHKVVGCHKYILFEKSPVLKNKLEHAQENTPEGCIVINIHDLDGDTIQHMINFMYFDELKDMDYVSSMKLFSAGHKYRIKCLKKKCSSRLRTFFSFQNSLQILVASEDNEDTDLKRCAIIYIKDNFSEISLTDEWKNFRRKQKMLADELLQLFQR
ncbi:hypothetical protein AVEN_216323-1 [Araneus ventricosus]|uniref:BTB domain-containing protein n=1 Tax=Araneus ventricosus TaxID=182803 RepID=A0A4Y2MQ08_ARAVE|nr:hypothetical protein AVEN_216323-1 [Araneus ventricosus]